MTDSTTLQVYEIPAENMPGLLHKLEGLSKKSQKLIGKPIALTVLGEVRKPVMCLINNRQRGVDASGARSPHNKGTSVQAIDAEGNFCWDVFYSVTIDAETPKINGWSFIATIDHSAAAGNVIRTSPNANCEVPEKYRTVKALCDHCGKIRSRRDTFLLRCDATGEFKQIGRQCIRDFIGYDVTSVVAMSEIVRDAVPSDSDGEWSGGMGDRAYIRVHTYMAHVAAVIRTAGWTSRKDAEYGRGIATSGHALTNMFPPRGKSDYVRIPLTDKDFETAEAALAWAAALADKPNLSEFDNNMSVLAREDAVEYRSTGILAYIVPAFFRANEREFQRVQRRAALNLANSQYVGTVGDKIGTKKGQTIAPFDAVLYGYSSRSGAYGVTHIYRFQSTDGNVFVWFASEGPAEALDLGGLDATKRRPVRINGGTVKKHNEYDGIKQTYLSRCKVAVVAAPEGEDQLVTC